VIAFVQFTHTVISFFIHKLRFIITYEITKNEADQVLMRLFNAD